MESQHIGGTPLTNPPPPSPIVSSNNKPSRKRLYISLAGVVILIVGILAGFIILKSPILFKSEAWDCGEYGFNLLSDGTIVSYNNSTGPSYFQRADVYINNSIVKTVEVPPVTPGEQVTLGNISLPSTTFTWQITGTSRCTNAGQFLINSVSYQCKMIGVIDENETEISSSELSKLKTGDTILFVVEGSGNTSDYTAAKFTINGEDQIETTTKLSNGNFYQEYEIPPGVGTFQVTAVLRAVDGNWY